MTLIDLNQGLAFLAAAMLVTLSPGPDNLMVLSLGAARGRRQGMAFGLGCALGCLSHTLLAALGVSALIAASPWAFSALTLAGGLYLVRLGWLALKYAGPMRLDNGEAPRTNAATLFRRGLVANAVNPKVILFFLAFLPQFVAGNRGDAASQIAQLGLLFTLQAALLFGTLGYAAGSIGQWLQRRPQAGLWLDRLAGMIFIGLGLRLIFSR